MTDSATIQHAALAEAYRRTRGHYPALDGLDLGELVKLFETDDAIVEVVEQMAYADLEPIMPFTSE